MRWQRVLENAGTSSLSPWRQQEVLCCWSNLNRYLGAKVQALYNCVKPSKRDTQGYLFLIPLSIPSHTLLTHSFTFLLCCIPVCVFDSFISQCITVTSPIRPVKSETAELSLFKMLSNIQKKIVGWSLFYVYSVPTAHLELDCGISVLMDTLHMSSVVISAKPMKSRTCYTVLAEQ